MPVGGLHGRRAARARGPARPDTSAWPAPLTAGRADLPLDFLIIQILNGLGAGLLLFMLSAGLTLIVSFMGVLNFAHASFYMLGAYLAWSVSQWAGFWVALVAAPVLTGLAGALFERSVLRRVRGHGHVAELLITFGLGLVILEGVQLVWGRTALAFVQPESLQGAAFTLVHAPDGGLSWIAGTAPETLCAAAQGVDVRCSRYPLTRVFVMAVSLVMLLVLWGLLRRTRMGLVIQAALTHPEMVQALGHDLPRVAMIVFGAGCALAGLAGVIGGMTFVTEPSMAALVGSVLFVVVVVGGLGSLGGALAASLLIGMLQTLPVAFDAPLASLLARAGIAVGPGHPAWPVARVTLAQAAPLLPYLVMVLVLILRPRGLLGTREG